MDSGQVQITSSASTITSAGLSLSAVGIGAYATYTIWFVTVNKLVSGSTIVMTFPAEISLASSSQPALTTHPFSSSSISGSVTATITLSAVVAAGSNVTINIANVKNPPTTTQTPTIQVRTYYTAGSTRLVDQLISGTMLAVQAGSVVAGGANLTALSDRVGDLTTYTLLVQVSNMLPTQSTMKVLIPLQSFPVSTVLLTSFSINGTAITGCSMTSISPMYFLFGASCFNVATPAFSIISVVLANITNPSSTKPALSWNV